MVSTVFTMFVCQGKICFGCFKKTKNQNPKERCEPSSFGAEDCTLVSHFPTVLGSLLILLSQSRIGHFCHLRVYTKVNIMQYCMHNVCIWIVAIWDYLCSCTSFPGFCLAVFIKCTQIHQPSRCCRPGLPL